MKEAPGQNAPYRIEKVDGGYAVFNDKGERKNDEAKSYDEARNYQQALYKNVPGARQSAEEDEQKKESRRHGRWVVADASSTDMGTGQGGGTGNTPGGPTAPNPGGSTPMTVPNPSASSDPFANTDAGPGPGPPAPAVPGTAPTPPTPAPTAARHGRYVVANEVRERPTEFNPSGVADEYEENTWDAAAQQRPMQEAQSRNVNTPQAHRPPPPTISSDTIRADEAEQEEHDDER